MIKVEIIAIGNEVLSGYIINRNAAYMSRALTSHGYELIQHTVVGDDPESIEEVLTRALDRCDVVITTGGLGPTLDDITRVSIARVMNCGMRFDEAVHNDLQKRYGNNLKGLDDQSTIPDKAIALLNPVGTAPGLLFEEHGKILGVLPGVPYEMQSLFTLQLLPWLDRKFNNLSKPHVASVNVIGIPEQRIDEVLRELQREYPQIKFGIYPNHWIVVVRMTADNPDLLIEPVNKLKSAFHHNIFESELGLISDAIHHLFKEKKLTLSCAESCTGGAIAAVLTQASGASEFFKGSIVAYSNEMKENFLDVPSELLQKFGAVSEETVTAMLKGLLSKVKSDWGIAVTGIAGPTGGTLEKPVGTVWCGIGKKNETPEIWKLELHSDRASNIQQTVNLILGKIYTKIS